MFTIFPLLTLSLVLYTALSFAGGPEWTMAQVMTIDMISGETWRISGGDMFLAFSLLLLFIEVLRATKTGTDSILNHAFSALLFIVCLLAFVIAPRFSTSAFFLLTLMTCLDFMAGFIVTTLAARRDFGVSGGLG
ncbi:MAG: hypothetical protein V2I43_05675 [Parvularcula sp.]|jgi:hypothetical protein|nr:hypothetical protein [Parvularcula sp.]